MSSKTSVDTIMKFAGGGAVALCAVYAIAAHVLNDDIAPGCMANYELASTFDLHSTYGTPLSPIELQARAGIGEVGLMQNARVVEVSNGPAPLALDVSLARVRSEDPSVATTSGIDFVWRPSALTAARSVCLRYSVFVPESFEWGQGGYLPGLFGNDDSGRGVDPNAAPLRLRMRWHRDGLAELHARAPVITAANGRVFAARDKRLRRGQWSTIEQELVLNAPSVADGSIKLWLNGELILNDRRVELAGPGPLTIDGVLAAVSHFSAPKSESASDALRLQLSPLELAWR